MQSNQSTFIFASSICLASVENRAASETNGDSYFPPIARHRCRRQSTLMMNCQNARPHFRSSLELTAAVAHSIVNILIEAQRKLFTQHC